MTKNPVVHFEMPFDDTDRVSDFYSKVFGWEMNKLGEEMSNYILAGTADTDDNRMIKNPGQINGGFFPKSEQSGDRTLITIQVEDLKDSMEMVKKNGGKVLHEPVVIQGIGLYVAIEDTEGNRVSLLQPTNP